MLNFLIFVLSIEKKFTWSGWQRAAVRPGKLLDNDTLFCKDSGLFRIAVPLKEFFWVGSIFDRVKMESAVGSCHFKEHGDKKSLSGVSRCLGNDLGRLFPPRESLHHWHAERT